MIIPKSPLPQDILSPLPGFEAVLKHTVVVDVDLWKRELAARGLPQPPQIATNRGRVGISGAELLAMGDNDPTAESAMELLIAAPAWALGLRASRLKTVSTRLPNHQYLRPTASLRATEAQACNVLAFTRA